ncbi:MAG: ABC transporter ATP-binding protein [Lachnospiraceae bacterium]|nr:ABC transporter ATP-binding protein [Lachnospiraceae bacterium]
MNGEIILTVTDLHLVFHDHDTPEIAVDDFDLTLEEGEIVGIVGESGSGKSLSALAIAGLLNRKSLKKSGRIIFDGVDLLTCDRKTLRGYQGDEISIIFQEPMTSLNPVKRIGWQVEESLRIHHPEIDKETRKKKAISMLEKVGLHDPETVYKLYPHELSGGMRQRVMIAAAMIGEPKILIADEPTTALDVTVQAQIVELLKTFNRDYGTSIIFISHDLSLVSQLCQRVMVMYQGNVVETGTAEEVFSEPRQAYTRRLIAAIPKIRL